MTGQIAEACPCLKARIAGFLYLITITAGMFAVFTRSGLIVSGDAAASARNILASEPLYRWTIAADLVAGASYVGVTALLYGLLRPVSQAVSLAAALFSLVGCAIGAVVTLNLVAALILLKGAPYLAAFGPDQLQALAKFFLSLHGQGYNISIFFFGFYCALLGYLVFKSTFFPRWLGVLLAIAGLGWLADSFATALWPTFADRLDSYAMMSGGIGEGALCVWLIAAGVNVPKWQEQARVGANP